MKTNKNILLNAAKKDIYQCVTILKKELSKYKKDKKLLDILFNKKRSPKEELLLPFKSGWAWYLNEKNTMPEERRVLKNKGLSKNGFFSCQYELIILKDVLNLKSERSAIRLAEKLKMFDNFNKAVESPLSKTPYFSMFGILYLDNHLDALHKQKIAEVPYVSEEEEEELAKLVLSSEFYK